MSASGQNHPFVVWSTCVLWLVSMFSIMWSLILFFCVSDILILTGTDLVNAFILLSGVVLLPTTIHMLCSISQNKRINHKTKVGCCPLWVCVAWILTVNVIGAILCLMRMRNSKTLLLETLTESMNNYRNSLKHKYFMDNLQWSLKCCGLKSYKDWFNRNWYDITRDYEWEPLKKRHLGSKLSQHITDSVPLSCCKSGSCISNYLSELGTSSINTRGCNEEMVHIVMISMSIHLVIFLVVIILELLVLKYIMSTAKTADTGRSSEYNVRHIMDVKENFRASSESCAVPGGTADDSDDSSKYQCQNNRTQY